MRSQKVLKMTAALQTRTKETLMVGTWQEYAIVLSSKAAKIYAKMADAGTPNADYGKDKLVLLDIMAGDIARACSQLTHRRSENRSAHEICALLNKAFEGSEHYKKSDYVVLVNQDLYVLDGLQIREVWGYLDDALHFLARAMNMMLNSAKASGLRKDAGESGGHVQEQLWDRYLAASGANDIAHDKYTVLGE